MKFQKRDIITFIFTFLLILSLYLTLKYLSTEGYACLNNPISYGIKFMEKEGWGEVTCTCSVKGHPNSVMFDSKGVRNNNFSNLLLNFSDPHLQTVNISRS